MPRIASGNSLVRALSLLRAILADRGRTPLAELAAALGLPHSTAHRMLDTLVAEGLVAKTASGRYEPSVWLTAAVQGLSPQDQLARVARPFLRELQRKTRLTAHLGILERGMVTYLVKETGRSARAKAVAVFTCEGGQLEAYCSAIGKVLLARMTEADRELYLADGPFVALTEQTITNPQRLRTEIELVGRQGFACDDGEISENLFCIAAPVGTPASLPLAAISLSMERQRVTDQDRRRLVGHLRETADRIEAAAFRPLSG